MDEKSLHMLEFPKILERLAGYAAFSASAELAHALRPSTDFDEVARRQACTREARHLLSRHAEISVGGARDVRPLVTRAARAGVLLGHELLEIKTTLESARDLARFFERRGQEFPHLAAIAARMAPPPGLIEAISRAVSERGEVLDSASPRLASLRSEIKIAHERLLGRLNAIMNDPKVAPWLQESLITLRNDRYVLPLKAEGKGHLRGIVHDQSASGATLFIEPLAVVDLNNAWHELQLAARDEERRILAALSAQVGAQAEAITTLVEALAEFDLALMCAKYADDLRAAEPVVLPFRPASPAHPGSTLRLYQARHPLIDPARVVPIDVVLDDKTYAVVITGPNTGGKTVSLKTVGLLVLMAQAGLHIPAQSGSTLSLFANVFADIGDEQSIEQSLSTFSAHITNIVRILKQTTPQALVLLDELGAGTDPQEGSALARAILAHLVALPVTCLVATHYPELKAFAHATPGVVNASVEFDLQTLQPTYHLTIGLPGRSNALAIAERLGLPPSIVAAAREMLNPADLRAEDLLEEIHRQRDLAQRARAEAEQARAEAEALRQELARQLERIEEERQAILRQAAEHAEAELAALRAEIERLRRELARARLPLEAIKRVAETVEALGEQAEKALSPAVAPTTPPERPELGERVRIRSLGLEGTVVAQGDEDVEVQLGNLRLRTGLHDIQRAGVTETPPSPPPATPRRRKTAPASATPSPTLIAPSPGLELDLRGQRADDALTALERHLEAAYLAGLPFVRIIHGKGTGRLRQAIREALGQNPYVATWERGLEGEGGDGVTIARLKSEAT
ncbi:endonuclease MutS2 [Thermanaerothrix sp. 4228-RoL]|uniref:Endonuclease MutS2 n=2 Tax=Thermanaerothrix TaxID=1077886 RepID=A0ABU3NRD8_9CHLR|nr:endonuclease MutS2 [Thermanaerothrix sp. 4228-RoL]MDT8898622.1 endonuclease MutS2 [Thermanaerothrix sp. 4228-RoL]